MAIHCRNPGLLFVQAPRTGCTAIEQLLIERFGGEPLPKENILDANGFVRIQRKHCTIAQLLREGLIPRDYQQRFLTVTTVRNPYDSLVSLYIKKREAYQEKRADPNSWVHQLRGYVEDLEYCRTHTFEEWLHKRYPVGKLDRLLGRGRRSLYGRYTAGIAVVMRFERLQEDFEALMRSLGVEEDVTIPNVNPTRKRKPSYQDYYTSEARRLVEYVFRPDFEKYGYTFDAQDQRPLTPLSVVPSP
jgi:hypothetical protein